MPPARNRAVEDSKAEGTNSKERGNGGATGKGKKAAATIQAAHNKDGGNLANNSTSTSQNSNACVCNRSSFIDHLLSQIDLTDINF